MVATYETTKDFDIKQPGKDYGTMTEREYFSNTTGATRKCWVFTPPKYNSEIDYPVMYLLHGIGGDHNEWLGGNPNEVISNLINEGQAKPMIVVIPNVRAMKNDEVPIDMFTRESILAFDNFINDLRDDLMPFIESNYKIKPGRENRAIAGLSMGGRETLFITFKMPETFKYVGAFSPAPGLLEMNHPADRAHPGQMTADEMNYPDEYKNDTFMLINTGNEEEMFTYISDAYKKAMDDNGVKYEYFLANGGHDFRTWKVGLYNFAKRIFI